jgi:hypothetical protein
LVLTTGCFMNSDPLPPPTEPAPPSRDTTVISSIAAELAPGLS